jgi:hypothetical protein
MLTEAQKQARLGRITSSLVAACLGRDDRKTPVDAWLEITGREPAKPFDERSEEACARGNRLEREVLEYGADVLKASRWETPPFVSLPGMPWAGDSADAAYYDDWDMLIAMGEGKTCAMGVAKQFGEEGSDEVPQRVYMQSLWHLIHHPTAPRCIAPTLQGGYRFAFLHYMIERDEEEQGLLLQDLERWHHDHVVMDIQPLVTAGDSEFIRMKFPRATREQLMESAAVELKALDTLVAKLEAREAIKTEENLCAELKDLMGEYGYYRSDSVSVTYRNVNDQVKINYAAMVDEMRTDYRGNFEELLERNTRLVEGIRRLTVSATKEKQ